MKRLQAYKFELIPNGAQIRAMRQYAGCCRVVYNKALAWQNEQYQADNTFNFSYTKIANLLPQWKEDLAWLRDAPSQTLQQSLKNLESSFRHFFAKRADYPRFKKKGVSDSFRFPQGFKIEQQNNRLSFPKLGWIKYRNSREIIGTVKNITVSFKCGKWYASIQTECEVEQPEHPATGIVGVDVGIARFATLSTGQVFEAVNSFKHKQAKLARYQRALARKVKFSSNWKKQKGKISKLHSTIANIRKDYLHKTSSAIIQNHAMIVIEDLQVGNMSKSAKGTIEAKGRNVKAKSGLNRSILDQGWFEFRRQLTYKTAQRGSTLVVADRWYPSSKACSCCGHHMENMPLSVRSWQCPVCEVTHHRDINAAVNLKNMAVTSTV
jgi:putative transposase